MRPIWRSKKFSFQSFLLVIFLAKVATSNASAIRHKRETIDDADSHVTTAIKSTTETTLLLDDIDSFHMDLTATEAPDLDDTTSSSSVLLLGKSVLSDITLSTTPLAQAQQQFESNANETTTLKNADVAKVTTSTTTKTTEAKILMDITTGSIPTAKTTAPKPTRLILTTLPQQFDVITSITPEPLTATTESQVTTIRNDEIQDTHTSYTINENVVITTSIPASELNISNTNRSSSDINETTTSKLILETTINTPENDEAVTNVYLDQILNEINFTTPRHNPSTDHVEEDTTTVNLLKIEQEEIVTNRTAALTTESNSTTTLEKLKIVSTNYDIATNEIKNSTTEDHLPANTDSEKRSKHIRGNEANLTIPNTAEVWALASMKNVNHTKTKESHAGNATTTTITPYEKSKPIKNSTVATKQLADWTEIVRNVDMSNTNNSNHSFTSNAVNSIENTLETGKIDDPVSNKITKQQQFTEESKVMPQIIDVPIANVTSHSISTTPSLIDSLVASTPSIEKNKVEDVEDIGINIDKKIIKGESIFREKLVSESTVIMSTTETNNHSNPTPTVNISLKENKIEETIDTTTKRMERSTSIPTTAAVTIHKTTKSTTDYAPLSTIPTELKYESTVANDELISGYDITETPSTTTETYFVESTTISESTLYTIASDSTTDESDSLPSITSSLPLETIRLATNIPSTTPMQQYTTKDIPTTTTQFLITETPTIPSSVDQAISTAFDDEYIIMPRNSPTKATIDIKQQSSSSLLPTLKMTMATTTTTTTADTQTSSTESVASNEPHETDYNVIIAISVSVVGIIALVLLVGFLYVMRKRQKSISYGQRCRPVSLDAYSLDNVSVFNSVRRKGILRASKRSYGNVAFDDPSLKHNSMSIHELARFVDRRMTIYDEFRDVPQIIARPDEVPPGCEDKNRYANVIPLPETRVMLTQINGDDKTEYINANYVRGPKDPPNYYIACQAPLESTVADFWRMLWEQNSRVIVMATDLIENGIEKSAEYLPPSITLDNHTVYGDFQITLKNREVKDSYAVSTLHVKNIPLNRWREITHFWYQWPETGVPNDEAGVIAMLLEARSCLKMGTPEQSDDDVEKQGDNINESTGSLDKTKSLTKTQGPLTVHCSPGTGRTGTIISCDMAIRSLETPKRILDIPQIVYYVRRGRASAVQTKEQYEFIYKVAHVYATKISGPINDN